MTRIGMVTTMALGCLLLGGCAGIMPGPGQVFHGAIFGATVTPGDLAGGDALYQAQPDSFKVLGWTEGTSSNVSVFGLFSFGNGGYLAALDDAKNKTGADFLISCTGDVHSTSFLMLFASSKTVVRGIAVKRGQ